MKNKHHSENDRRVKFSLFSPLRFLFYFIFVGFIVTVSFLLFFSGDDKDIHLEWTTLNSRAIRTLVNILFLCVAFSVIDIIKKKITIGRPINRIIEATRKITNGDFSVRIKPINSKIRKNEFDVIIDNFNKMAQELSTTETLKLNFISDVSHEIKTPLSVIQNCATMLQSDTISNEEKAEYARRISTASSQLNSLITNILKLNKLDNQEIFPEKKAYNLSEQLCECLLLFEEAWDEKGLELKTDMDESVVIEADGDLLANVWINIISNAVKFTDPKGCISVTLKKDDDCAMVTISDTGCGMDEETGKHIFEKFYQGDSSRSTKGNGLGLALVKRIMDIVHGDITVRSQLGQGSEFSVRLPLK